MVNFSFSSLQYFDYRNSIIVVSHFSNVLIHKKKNQYLPAFTYKIRNYSFTLLFFYSSIHSLKN